MAHVDRVAMRVDDLDAAVADFTEIFGMEFEVMDAPALGLRIAISNEGVELVEVPDGAPKLIENYVGGVFSAFSVNVPDLQAVRQKLLERGVELIMEMETAGFREIYCANETFHGLPLTVTQYGGNFVNALLGPGDAPKITWHKPEFAPDDQGQLTEHA
jgi:catechol 2,3-dioxygenase-like lactoylglutathione lyase family enzyme